MSCNQTRRVHRRWTRMAFEIGCALAGLSVLAGPVAAQRPTRSEIAAIRQACREDYRTHCRTVPTGGPEALACLRRNESSLSAACQQALDAIGSAHGTSLMRPEPDRGIAKLT